MNYIHDLGFKQKHGIVQQSQSENDFNHLKFNWVFADTTATFDVCVCVCTCVHVVGDGITVDFTVYEAVKNLFPC